MYQASKKFGDAIAGSNRKFNTRLLENEKVLVESKEFYNNVWCGRNNDRECGGELCSGNDRE